MKDRVLKDIGANESSIDWQSINWQLVKKRIRNLRRRIFRATREKKWNQVRSLMKLVLRSQANALLAIRRVTVTNKGKKTTGIDKKVYTSSRDRERLYQEIKTYTPWKASPTRRVYIPKANGKSRPLGIPTITDRVMQAIVKNALEPRWEAEFEANSYGFRPGRSTHDAITQAWNNFQNGRDKKWVLDADIKGAFDNIDHRFILDKLGNIPGRELIKQWLRAGYVESSQFNPTESGTPQGGIISPLLSNIALDGLEAVLSKHRKGCRGKAAKQYVYVRYADDFIIGGRTKEDLENILPTVKEWLAERGLTLNEEKTQIRHISEGFNFLGFTIIQHDGRCFTFPQKEKVLQFVRKNNDWLKQNPAASAEQVVRHLSIRLRGWGNYYRHGASKRMFSYVDDQLYRRLWLWIRRKHKKHHKRMAKQYFQPSRYGWKFQARHTNRRGHDQTITISRLMEIPITRHVKVQGTASPDDPSLAQYWEKRGEKIGKDLYPKGTRKHNVANQQNWKCPVCQESLFNGESIEMHHIKPVAEGGYEREDNLELLHKNCHRDFHGRRA